jgi:sugar transferase (PEP-CTERM/EpsH1 system associated)
VATLTGPHAGAPDARPLIAHLVHRFAVGGLENGVVNLINHMPHHRWRHVVIALTEVDPGFSRRILRDDVSCLSLHKPPGQGLWLYPRLWRLLRQLQPAIVHTRNLGALEFQVPAALAGVPGRIHGEHGRDVDDVDGTNRRHIAMRRLYRHFVHQHIALGSELGGYLQHKVGVPAAALHTIYNGVDQARFTPATERQAIEGCPFSEPGLWLLGTVGRMQTVKAQPVLAQAFVQALQAQPALRQRLRLLMVGGGELQAECQAILQAAGMADLTWLPGERADVPDVMRGLDCFVLPSLAEGISNTILEAMSTALPVLATRVGANAELVAEGRTGHLVPAGDAQALAQGVLRMAADPVAARAMGQAGRQLVEQRFSLQAMVGAYESVYRRVLRQPVAE